MDSDALERRSNISPESYYLMKCHRCGCRLVLEHRGGTLVKEKCSNPDCPWERLIRCRSTKSALRMMKKGGTDV